MEDNKELNEEKQKYEEIIDALEEKLKTESDRSQAREKKLQRELALEKRRVGEANKHLEDLRKELRSNQAAQAEAMKKKPKPARPQSSHPSSGFRAGHLGRGVSAAGSLGNRESQAETEAIRMKNRELEDELKNIKIKLQESEYELKKKEHSPVKQERAVSKQEK